MSAIVTAVCVMHELREGYYHETAIDKRPVEQAVDVTELGIAGDRQVDSSHGGRDAAVYVYADEDAAYWSDELGREIPPGFFSENVRTEGLEVTDARIGERWRIGDVLLEVRQPRAGDLVVVERRPDHAVTVASTVTGMSAAAAQGLLDSGLPLVALIRHRARRAASQMVR